MSTTATYNTKPRLIARYHGLCRTLNLSKDIKLHFLAAWNVKSSTELTIPQLYEVIDTLQGEIQRYNQAANNWRRRVIAAIAGFLDASPEFGEMMAREAPADPYRFKMNYIIGIACKASGCDEFNNIPIARLQNLYNCFLRKQKDATAIEQAVYDIKMSLLTANL